ncbi:MAG: Lrp/AsnC family transcriptional regulator [Angelakisella sp.]
MIMQNKLLSILADNARLSCEQLAAMTGMTAEAVATEIDRLQAEGIIKGYKAIIDWDKTDRSLCIARIELRVLPKSGMGFEEIAQTIAQFDEVETVYLMSGGYDLALTVSGKTFKDVATFVSHRLAPLESVQSTATHFVLRKYKERGILTADDSDDGRELL